MTFPKGNIGIKKERKKYKNRIERAYFNNRWRRYPHNISGDWTILGIQQWYSSWDCYFIAFCFFGLELRLWFKKSAK